MTQDFDGQVRQLIGDQLSSMIEAAIVREMTSERLLAVLTSGSPPVGLPLIWRARQLVEGGRLQPRQLTATAERLFQAYLAERDPAKRRIETELKNLLPLLEPVTREGLARRMLSTARKSARRIAVRILVKDSPSDLADLLREAYSATHDKYVLGALVRLHADVPLPVEECLAELVGDQTGQSHVFEYLLARESELAFAIAPTCPLAFVQAAGRTRDGRCRDFVAEILEDNLTLTGEYGLCVWAPCRMGELWRLRPLAERYGLSEPLLSQLNDLSPDEDPGNSTPA